MNKPVIVISLLVGLTGAVTAQSEDSKPEFDLEASAGYQHDSNVNVAELDDNTGRADNALLLELGLDSKLPVTEKLIFTAAYGFSSTTHDQFSEFDLAMHHVKAGLDYRFSGFDSGLSVDHFAASLDGDSYLKVTQVAPNLSRLFGESFYLRGSYIASDKAFDANPGRNADNAAIRADAYVLFDGMRRFLSLSYVMDREDAHANEFDYNGMRTKIAYGQTFDFGRKDLKLKSHLQYENRDYSNMTESIGAARHDKRLRAGLSAALALSEHLEMRGEAEYGDSTSNLAAANFEETVYSLNVGLAF